MWTIDGKEVIRLGHKTTHGGTVISASPTVSYGGIPIARIGDMVVCPLCKGVFLIMEGAATASDLTNNIARHGDAVACGAKLVAGNHAHVTQGMGFLYLEITSQCQAGGGS